MFHLRFTPYDISGYTFDFLKVYSKYIVAFENKTREGNDTYDHYHILIETDYGKKSISDAVKANLKIPKSTRGKNNAYYALQQNWHDPGYICKYNDIRDSKGYSEKEIMEYVISGKKKYLDKVKESELSGKVAPAASSKQPKVSFQQLVLSDAAADWYKYKREVKEEDPDALPRPVKIVKLVCDAMRRHGKGINQYLVKELAFAVLYDDLEYRDVVLSKVENFFLQ